MMTTHRIRYGWHTYREGYRVTCRSCGKAYCRTTSTGFNEMATPEDRAKYRVDLKAEAARLSQIPFTCDACRRSAIATVGTITVVDQATLAQIAVIESEQAALDQRKRAIEKEVGKHRHRLFLHDGIEYVQWGCSFGWGGEKFTIHGYRVHKNRPWETTDHQVHAPLSEITYLDDTIEARRVAAGGAA
jgi:hypothetical protein